MTTALVIIFYPPTYIPINNEIHEFRVNVDGEEKEVEAVLAWKQNSIKVKKIFVLFPTSRELVFYAEKDEVEVTPSKEFLEAVGDKYDDNFNAPMWKYYLFAIGATIIALTFFVGYVVDEREVDKESWEKTVKEDSFAAYSRYLLFADWFSFHKKEAKNRMQQRAKEYKVFINTISGNSIKPNDNVLLKILDYIQRSGDQTITVQLKHNDSTEEVIPMVKNLKKELERDIQTPDLSEEKYGEYKNGIDLCNTALTMNYEKVKPYFTKKHFEKREKALVGVLSEMFKIMFGDYVVLLEKGNKSKGMILEIDYKVVTNPEGTCSLKEESLPLEQRLYYPQFVIYWDIVFSIDSTELLRSEIDTLFDKQFSWYLRPGGYYDAYMLKSFGDFAIDFLALFGFSQNEEIDPEMVNETTDDFVREINEIKDDIKDQMKENLLEDYKTLAKSIYERNSLSINSMLNGLPNKIENYLEEYSDVINTGTEIYDTASEVMDLIKDD